MNQLVVQVPKDSTRGIDPHIQMPTYSYNCKCLNKFNYLRTISNSCKKVYSQGTNLFGLKMERNSYDSRYKKVRAGNARKSPFYFQNESFITFNVSCKTGWYVPTMTSANFCSSVDLSGISVRRYSLCHLRPKSFNSTSPNIRRCYIHCQYNLNWH